jgi:hypothetical protein
MAVTDEALWAVAKNAIRHLIEANEHYKGQRAASALASAVFAVEETGKMSLLAFHGETPKTKKHAAQAILFYALIRVASWGWTWEWAKLLQNALGGDVILSEQQQRIVAEHPEFAELVRLIQAGELKNLGERQQAFANAIVAKDKRDGTEERWRPLLESGLQKFRLRATYVDVKETGVSSPESIQLEEASAMCSLACALLSLLLSMLLLSGRLTMHKNELVSLFPDDLIGLKEINTFMQAFQSSASDAPKAGDPPQPTTGA